MELGLWTHRLMSILYGMTGAHPGLNGDGVFTTISSINAGGYQMRFGMLLAGMNSCWATSLGPDCRCAIEEKR